MTEPLRPEHANTRKPVPGAPGFEIGRHLAGYAYPNNGNVHNPTPRYVWNLLLDGRMVDTSQKRRPLVVAARAPGAAREYSA